jgi:NADH:ubiquinone oxidoreductase subunit 5 (subunit L)/multisubunit Na+/H+ antiporter MnhA subunit
LYLLLNVLKLNLHSISWLTEWFVIVICPYLLMIIGTVFMTTRRHGILKRERIMTARRITRIMMLSGAVAMIVQPFANRWIHEMTDRSLLYDHNWRTELWKNATFAYSGVAFVLLSFGVAAALVYVCELARERGATKIRTQARMLLYIVVVFLSARALWWVVQTAGYYWRAEPTQSPLGNSSIVRATELCIGYGVDACELYAIVVILMLLHHFRTVERSQVEEQRNRASSE